jgi:predicted nucleic acid-binding protein
VILVDTGPLVALFDPRDGSHDEAKRTLAGITDDLATTVPVLTEAFHLLDPASQGARALRTFVSHRGIAMWWLSNRALARAFRLMDQYGDHPMDLADASLVVAAETLRTTKIFTIDRRDFLAYRAKIGRTTRSFTIV